MLLAELLQRLITPTQGQPTVVVHDVATDTEYEISTLSVGTTKVFLLIDTSEGKPL